MLWDTTTYPCLRYLLLAPKSSIDGYELYSVTAKSFRISFAYFINIYVLYEAYFAKGLWFQSDRVKIACWFQVGK